VSEVTPYSEKDFETFLTSVGAEDEGGTVRALTWNEWQGGLTINFLIDQKRETTMANTMTQSHRSRTRVRRLAKLC